MSVEENNDSMIPSSSETPEQPQAPVTQPPDAQETPVWSVMTNQPPEDAEFSLALVAEDGRVLDPVGAVDRPPAPEDIEMQRRLPFLSSDFAPSAHGLIVHYPNGDEDELSNVVAEILEYVQDPKYGDHPYYPLNDIGVSRLFADSYKYMLRYVTEAGKWYAYEIDKGVWVPGVARAMEYCKDFVQMLRYHVNSLCKTDDSVSRRIKSAVNKWQSERARKTMLKDAASVHPISMSEFDKDPYIFNCKNGTLNFKTWRFTRHNPEDFLTKRANVAYKPEAQCTRWLQHMEDVLLGDVDLGIYLQKALGYALTGDTRFECFFVLFGPTTRNGKGVTMNTYLEMLGDYGCNANPATIMEKKYVDGSAPSEDIARLAGARFVTFNEPTGKMVISGSLIKTLTGNDTVTARRLFENSFEYKPTYKIFIGTNYLPKVTDPTIFTSGRARVIPFDRHFEPHEQDPELKEKLTRPESLSGILNWCIRGLRYLSNKNFSPESFAEPAAVRNAINKYAQASGGLLADEKQQGVDPITRFIDDVLEPSPGSEVRVSATYGLYCEWCEMNGFDACSIKMFRPKMEAHVKIARKRPADKSGKNPVSTIIDYKFKSEDKG